VPPRAGLPNVVFPTGDKLRMTYIMSGEYVRLPAEDITLAEMLMASGYRTAMIGKWHMGDRSPSLPNDMGFDQYVGARYSNDMTPFALYRDNEVEVEAPVDQTTMDTIYTREAVSFLAQQGDAEQPFFLYFAHNFPHVPLFTAEDRAGTSEAGLYGDVVEALDAGVVQIVAQLEQNGQLDNTIIIISSDNGPWWQGDASAVRGRKDNTWEGGMRVPFIVHWPAGLGGSRQIDGIAMGTDLVPTIADWLQLPLPQDRIIDGKSIAPMLASGGATPHEYLYYFAKEKVAAVRNQTHKYLDERSLTYAPMDSGLALTQKHGPWLIDMRVDDREAYDTSLHDPETARVMEQALAAKTEEMKGNMRGWID
jgi:arylsulfatase A-like enzyme